MEIVSAEQFVDGLIAALRLQGVERLDLDNPKLDEQFAKAYTELLENAERLGIVPDFVISPDPFYGDSTCLRDTILAMRDLRSVALNNPRFVRLTISTTGRSPDEIMAESGMPPDLLQGLAKKYLTDIA